MLLAAPAASDIDFVAHLRVELERRIAVTPAMVHSIDERGRLISVSDTWLSKLGYAREEVLGRLSSDFLTAASRDHAVRDVLPEFFRTGRCENVPYQLACEDGTIIDVLLSGVLDRGFFGRGCVSLAVITDVTALMRTKRQLAESEARYRLLAENSTDVITVLSRDGTCVYVSPACFSLSGYTPKEMRAMWTGDSTHPDDVERVLDMLANQLGRDTVTYRMRRKDGSYVWVETTCKPLDGPGKGDLRLAIVRNVDERMRADQRLQESEMRYRFLADNSTDLIMLVGHDGKCDYVSPACEKLLGFTSEEMLGLNTRDAIHPDDTERVLAILDSDERMRTNPTISYRALRKDGSYIWVETTGKSVDLPSLMNQRPLIIRDIEQRRQAEQRLKDSEERYRMLVDNSSDTVFQLDRELVRRYVSRLPRTAGLRTRRVDR